MTPMFCGIEVSIFVGPLAAAAAAITEAGVTVAISNKKETLRFLAFVGRVERLLVVLGLALKFFLTRTLVVLNCQALYGNENIKVTSIP